MNDTKLTTAYSFARRFSRASWLGAALVLMALPGLAATYTLDIQVNPLNNGSVSGYNVNAPINTLTTGNNLVSDPLDLGVQYSITASNVATRIFSYWSGSLAGTLADTNSRTTTFTLESSGTLIANFDRSSAFSVGVQPAQAGQGTTTPSGSTNVPRTRPFSVKATPASGHEFSRWTVSSGTPVIADPLAAETAVTPSTDPAGVYAQFQIMPRLTVTAPSDGDISVETPTTFDVVPKSGTRTYAVASNAVVYVTALPGADKEFLSWLPTTGVVLDPSNSTTQVVMNRNKSLTVQFKAKVDKRSLIVLAGPNGTASPFGTNAYALNSLVDITATPDAGYSFRKWTAANGGPIDPALALVNPLVNIQMSQDRSYMAHFTNTYTVTVGQPAGPGTPSLTFSVAAGTAWSQTPVQVIIGNSTIRERLKGWMDGTGDVVPATGSGSTVSVPSATRNSAFNWAWQRQVRLDVVVSGNGVVSPATDENGLWLDAGSTNTLTATADAGYVLDAWKVNGVVLSHKNENFSLIMDEPKRVEAVFIAAGDRYIPLWWKQMFGLDSTSTDPNDAPDGDPDGDGLSNWQEYSMMVTNVAGFGALLMNPISADTDADGLDDGYEFRHFDVSRKQDAAGAAPDAAFISAALIDTDPYGRNSNPDGDYLWDTSTGYSMSNQPLSNLQEYVGPDGQGPLFETVPWQTVFPAGAAVSWRKDVLRVRANPADTLDQSNPMKTDTDNDNFDDGYEFSWDRWQRANSGAPIQAVTNWPAITGTVPDWQLDRWYHPSVNRETVPATLGPDFDWLYNVINGAPVGGFDDFMEYHASDYVAGSNTYPLVRSIQRDAPWCTNPFLWDTDGDGLPDGWEITFGYDPWAIDTDNDGESDALENPDCDAFAVSGTGPVLFHREVYDAAGFNPTTAWLPDDQTKANYFNNLMEFIGSAVIGQGGVFNAEPTWRPGTQTGRRTSNPRTVDTDYDGMFDGWELYLGFNPQSAADASPNPDGPVESLRNWQEFIGSDVLAYWRGRIAAGVTPDAIQTAWSDFSFSWPNKLLPTDPFDPDTDHDQLLDSVEQQGFNYSEGTAGAGGGLNPGSVDTDLDYLPDAWELYVAGSQTAGTNGVAGWSGGVNGTVADAKADTDGDGLYNYQEYMVGACYQFQWKLNDGSVTLDDPMQTGYDPYDFFDITLSGNNAFSGPGGLAPYPWDPAFYADRMRPFPFKPFTFMSGIPSLDPALIIFSTAHPGAVDTDHDGYDDYYELYHSLNPIRGSMDAVSGKLLGVPEAADLSFLMPIDYGQPFRWGERPVGPVADYDQDGQVDVEENLTVNLPAVQSYTHTDPSPYFVTDISADESFVNRFFKLGQTFGAARYWYWDDETLLDRQFPAAYLFSFEMNEGYDTDNDLVADGVEIVGNTPGATDPLDEDSPLRQRALYLNGTDAAARVYAPGTHSWQSFRAFTVEAWVRPISLTGDRVIVERAGSVTPGNPGLPGAPRVTRNFRLGLRNGTPYVAYDGYGINWSYQEIESAPAFTLVANRWTHLAAVYDPVTKQLKLFVDGELAASKNTTQIPFNGFVAGDPGSTEPLPAYGMAVTVGAGDLNPSGVCDGTLDDIKSGRYFWGLPPGNSFPQLTDYFHGWIDEVHLWDGVRTADQIRQLRTQKLTRQLINAINGVQTGNQTFQGDMGGSELNPKMLYAFTFDGLPDPSEGIIPQGFESTVQVPGYTGVPWWSAMPSGLRSSVYDDARYVKWIQNMASHQPFDPPRDTRVVRMFKADGTPNVFPNTSNPYTFEYVHGLGGGWEVHPQYGMTASTGFTGLGSKSAPREYSGVYGDLLPLGGASADSGLTMWDGSQPADQTRDQDGDGIPDSWEESNGMDPHNPLDAEDDPDRDGLSNRQEYNLGTNPFGSNSTGNVPDFFAYLNGTDGPYRFLGEEFTDMDYMDDLWEAAYGLNTEMFDAVGPGADPDGDGWSNLAEFQDLYRLRGTQGDAFMPSATNLFDPFTPLEGNAFYMSLLGDLSFLQNQDTTDTNAVIWNLEWNDPRDDRYFPVPELIFRFQYAGKNRALTDPRFVVLAYSDRGMDVPDASIRGTGDRMDTYPRYMALNNGRANSFSYEGKIREGQNWFWGFMDLNGDNEYQAGEPGGFAGPVNVRWGSVGPIDIPLTDKRPMGFARFSWTPEKNADRYHVYIVDRNMLQSPTVFYRVVSGFRTFIHEGDLRTYPKLGKGFKHTGGYQWFVRAEYDNSMHDVANGMVYETYASPLPPPTIVWPTGNARLRQSLDTFIWKMDPSVTLCELVVKRRDSGATVLTHSFVPPARDVNGRYKMQMPIYIGDGTFNNGVYDYILSVRNPLGRSAVTNQFSVKVGDYAGYSYSLSGTFIYPGKVPNGVFVAEAYTSPGFGGVPAGRCVIPNTIKAGSWPTNVIPFVIRGLPADDYYVRVHLDQNGVYPNYTADDFESQGWYAKNFYWPESVTVSGNSTTVLTEWVKVLMRDLDNDRLPDDWEYRWNGNLDAFGLGSRDGYTPALTGLLNVFQCYGKAPLGISPL